MRERVELAFLSVHQLSSLLLLLLLVYPVCCVQCCSRRLCFHAKLISRMPLLLLLLWLQLCSETLKVMNLIRSSVSSLKRKQEREEPVPFRMPSECASGRRAHTHMCTRLWPQQPQP